MINKITIFDPTLFTTEGDEGVALRGVLLGEKVGGLVSSRSRS